MKILYFTNIEILLSGRRKKKIEINIHDAKLYYSHIILLYE